MTNIFSDPTAFETGIANVQKMFGMDADSKRAATESTVVKLVADILNSKSSDWPEHKPTDSPYQRFMAILHQLLSGKSVWYNDSVGFKPVASTEFKGIRFYGVSLDRKTNYHILNLSYATIDKWWAAK